MDLNSTFSHNVFIYTDKSIEGLILRNWTKHYDNDKGDIQTVRLALIAIILSVGGLKYVCCTNLNILFNRYYVT